jgi:hypothetical protein
MQGKNKIRWHDQMASVGHVSLRERADRVKTIWIGVLRFVSRNVPETCPRSIKCYSMDCLPT